MAEKHVKEILEKLEEIEKLHVKLRSMVARIKRHETGSSADVDCKSSKPRKRKVSITSNEKERNSWKEKLSDIGIDAEKLQHPRGSKYLKKLRGNSLNFVAEQWRDKKEKMKSFLTGLVERDIIFVTRASQTSDSIVPKAMPDAQQTGSENMYRGSRNDVSYGTLVSPLVSPATVCACAVGFFHLDTRRVPYTQSLLRCRTPRPDYPGFPLADNDRLVDDPGTTD